MTSVINGYYALWRSRRGTLNTVDSNQLLSVEPDPSHPTGKAMCMKGRAAPDIAHSPHRVFYPMRRTTPKGRKEPAWKRIRRLVPAFDGWDREQIDQVLSASICR
jgi:predicted molibdopterin-dependent oxidoreductase YjgC